MLIVRKFPLVLLTLSVLLAGCGGGTAHDGVKTYPTTVDVKLDGGAVPDKIALRLTPTAPMEKVTFVQGLKNRSGLFVLETYRPDDGAPPGEYDVSLVLGDMTAMNTPVPQIEPVKLTVPPKGGALQLELKGTGETGGSPLPNPRASRAAR